MTTLMIYHEVDDVDHWLTSPRREELFPSLGLSVPRTFVDPEKSNRVGLVVDCPDLAAFQRALESDEAADAMKYDGVRPETIVILTEA